MFQQRRTPVRIPLSPAVLLKLGAFEGFPAIDPSFDPEGEWEHLFSIWTCHGYNEEGNYHDGFLRIKKTNENGKTRLNIEKQFVNEEALTHVMKANILCDNDSYPVEWEFSNQHLSPEGEQMKNISFLQKGSVKDDRLKMVYGKKASNINLDVQILSDWNLFDFVQKIAFKKQSEIKFSLFERLELLKENQFLKYRGAETFQQGISETYLHRFSQTGEGILPFDYWLDDSHKLFLAITFSVAYIADDSAMDKFQARRKELKKRYDSRKERFLNR